MTLENHEPKKIHIGAEEVILDTKLMEFNEATLSSYIEKEGGLYAYYGEKLADAEYAHQRAEQEYEVLYARKFKTYKESGGSDKLAESSAKADIEVEEAKKRALTWKYKVRLLQQHLRAYDKNHDNAQSRGHMLRKEMDKLGANIYGQTLDDRVKEFIKDEYSE